MARRNSVRPCRREKALPQPGRDPALGDGGESFSKDRVPVRDRSADRRRSATLDEAAGCDRVALVAWWRALVSARELLELQKGLYVAMAEIATPPLISAV